MKKQLFKTLVAVLAIAAAAAGPVRGQTITDPSEEFITTQAQTTYTGQFITLNCTNAGDIDGLNLNGDNTLTVTSTGGTTISTVVVLYKNGAGSSYAAYTTSTQGTIGDPVIEANNDRSVTISNVNATSVTIGNTYSASYIQIKQVTVYYSFPAPTPHTVRFAAGHDGWMVTDVDSARSATAPAILNGVMAGDSLVVTAPASLNRKVKSVKAVKFVAPAATVTTAPTATAGTIAAGSTTALVGAGAANGGTMMYAVTTTNAQPASTADFSATIPTAEGRTAGTYYVWFYVKADADHADSEIAGPVSVTLAEVITWNSSNVFNSSNEDVELSKTETTPLTYEGITISRSGTGVSYFTVYGGDGASTLVCYGQLGDSFTFTAPSGKKFSKVEIINNGGITFTEYGDWTKDAINNKIVWSGTAANAVTLGGSNVTSVLNINSIVFTLIDAQ